MSHIYRTIFVRGVIRDEGRILDEELASKAISFLPGGTAEIGETLEETLIRELDEELGGLDYKVGQYLGQIGHIWKTSSGADSCLNHFYEVAFSKNSKIEARESGRKIKWISSQDFLSNNLQPPSLRKLLLSKSSEQWNIVDDER